MLHKTRQRTLQLATVTALLLSLVLAAPVAAAPTTLTTGLTGAQEVPGPGDTDGTGIAEITIDPVAASGSQLCYDLAVSNITLPAAGAHIHEGGTDVAGPIVVTLGTPDATGVAVGCVADGDFNLGNSGDPDIATLLADILANPGDYYVNVHTSDFSAGAVRGQLAGMLMIMKHLCNPSIQSEADFQAVEARAATNPTTPMGVPSFGSTAETVLACPTIVQPGDGQTPGAIGSGSRAFDFTAQATGGLLQTLSTGTTFSGDDGFTTALEDFACESDLAYDADRDGSIEGSVCLDFSSYAFSNVFETGVTVREIAAPPGSRFGTVRLTPAPLSDDASAGLSFTPGDPNGVITVNAAADADAMITLHVYNFQAAVAPPPAASQLPDSSTEDSGPASGSLWVVLFAVALLSSGLVALRLIRREEVR